MLPLLWMFTYLYTECEGNHLNGGWCIVFLSVAGNRHWSLHDERGLEHDFL